MQIGKPKDASMLASTKWFCKAMLTSVAPALGFTVVIITLVTAATETRDEDDPSLFSLKTFQPHPNPYIATCPFFEATHLFNVFSNLQLMHGSPYTIPPIRLAYVDFYNSSFTFQLVNVFMALENVDSVNFYLGNAPNVSSLVFKVPRYNKSEPVQYIKDGSYEVKYIRINLNPINSTLNMTMDLVRIDICSDHIQMINGSSNLDMLTLLILHLSGSGIYSFKWNCLTLKMQSK
ncbi:hypothetical protein HELRODRAFT_171096 [Helobdella robusta]|uniref:Uncharacterized protein n=1 Tax=Helobdella robusta TaxID=6412 RepID=T1F3T1_HELRO|nr:hypothetical protein HELRODRAFT_171096 [Helobdella robusta]ESO05466.1 hypothetical protein HELRODRAFT_171096 [Helobdella robusta]